MNENRKINEEKVFEILHTASLKMRLEVFNDMALQTHLIEIGVIPEGFWSDEKEKKYGKLWRKFAKVMTKHQLRIVKEWEKDGRPK
jgi:hypothetical protein